MPTLGRRRVRGQNIWLGPELRSKLRPRGAVCPKVKDPVDQQDIATALRLEALSGRRGLELGWLERSQQAPGPFFDALHEAAAKVSRPGPKSAPAQGYDLYHDLVARHRGNGSTALELHDPRAPKAERWTKLDYAALHARCSRRAQLWAAAGVGPGAIVCVMLPPGEDCLISLLCGLQLGACVSLLDPRGPDFLALRLENLGAAFIATDAYYLSWFEDPSALGAELLRVDAEPARAGPGRAPSSHTYAPDEPCALLFSPLRRPLELPVPLTAEQAYRGALRDGAVCLALRPGTKLAAPGFDPLQHQPALLFAALIMGACWVELDEQAVIEQPELLAELELRSVGLSGPVREALCEAQVRRPRWDHVFKNPEEPLAAEDWSECLELLELRQTLTSNLVFDAASGGALLCSPRRKGQDGLPYWLEVCVAAGRPWTLLDFSGTGQASVSEVGVFAPLGGVEQPEDDEAGEPLEPQHIVLARRRGLEYLYANTLEPRRCGRVYPSDELLATLADCPFLYGASVLALPTGGAAHSYRFVLLGFVGHEASARFDQLRAARVSELERVIETRLGVDALPDRIELFLGYARLVEGEVDHLWSHRQYVTGCAYRKHRSATFHQLHALREALTAPGGGP